MPKHLKKIKKRQILDKIEDPHAKDIANLGFTATDCIQALTESIGIGLCYGICAGFCETTDHFMSSICFATCTIWSGALTYRCFRKVWQRYSIPIKDTILSFFGF